MKRLLTRPHIFIFLLLLTTPLTLSAIFTDDNLTFDAIEVNTGPGTTRSLDTVIAGIMSSIITVPLWKSTAPFHSRNMLDLLPAATLFKTDNDISVHLFYSKDNQLPLGIDNTLAITSQNYSLILQTLQPADGEAAIEVLQLLNDVNVEQRHAGLLINSFFSIGDCNFSFSLPIGIAERNLFTSEEAQNNMQKIINQLFPGVGSFFDKKREFARIKGGIGDLRLNLGYAPIKTKFLNASLGATTIIPTAVGVTLDGKFKNPVQNEFEVLGLDFTRFLNATRTLLLEPLLGNDGHASLGIFGETKFTLIPKTLFWRNYGWFDYVFPAVETRLIMNQAKMSASFVSQQGPTEAIADEYEIEYLVPRALQVNIKPGNVFSYSTGLEYVWRYLQANCGYNFYFREKENFKALEEPLIDIHDLNIENAMDDALVQHQIFGELNFRFYKPQTPLCVGIGGGYNFSGNKNSPSSWNAFIKCSWSF